MKNHDLHDALLCHKLRQLHIWLSFFYTRSERLEISSDYKESLYEHSIVYEKPKDFVWQTASEDGRNKASIILGKIVSGSESVFLVLTFCSVVFFQYLTDLNTHYGLFAILFSVLNSLYLVHICRQNRLSVDSFVSDYIKLHHVACFLIALSMLHDITVVCFALFVREIDLWTLYDELLRIDFGLIPVIGLLFIVYFKDSYNEMLFDNLFIIIYQKALSTANLHGISSTKSVQEWIFLFVSIQLALYIIQFATIITIIRIGNNHGCPDKKRNFGNHNIKRT